MALAVPVRESCRLPKAPRPFHRDDAQPGCSRARHLVRQVGCKQMVWACYNRRSRPSLRDGAVSATAPSLDPGGASRTLSICEVVPYFKSNRTRLVEFPPVTPSDWSNMRKRERIALTKSAGWSAAISTSRNRVGSSSGRRRAGPLSMRIRSITPAPRRQISRSASSYSVFLGGRPPVAPPRQ